MSDEESQVYQVAYRRHRPRRFQDVMGQGHITDALRKSVQKGTTAHTYLLSGYHGCGKTTTARILAAAINCVGREPESGPDWDGEPCGECSICSMILSGEAWQIGVKEHNCGENNGVDAVRELLSEADLGSIAKFRIYILDEAHHLSTQAQTALLKGIEEPSDNTMYILATTHPDKLIPTIKSRSTKFNFPQVEPATLHQLVVDVAKKDGFDLSEDNYDSIVQQGNGSPRDTLSALEKLTAGGTLDSTTDYVDLIIQGLVDSDMSAVFISIGNAIQEGQSAQELGSGITEYLRNCILMLQAPNLVQATLSARERIAEHASFFKTAKLMRLMEIVTDTIGSSRGNVDPRILLERAMVQALLPETRSANHQMIDMISNLQEEVTEVYRLVEKLTMNGVQISGSSETEKTGTDGDSVWGGSDWGGPPPEQKRPSLVSVPKKEDEPVQERESSVPSSRRRLQSREDEPQSVSSERATNSASDVAETPSAILANIKEAIGRRYKIKLAEAEVKIIGKGSDNSIEISIVSERELADNVKQIIADKVIAVTDYRIVEWDRVS